MLAYPRSEKAEPVSTLVSWKEIAVFLNRSESTVKRWERERGLPVHRVPGGERGGVYAFGAGHFGGSGDEGTRGQGNERTRDTGNKEPRDPGNEGTRERENEGHRERGNERLRERETQGTRK